MNIASITYDNQATLRDFAARKNITYAMLADPGSHTIRRFRMVDPDNTENNVPSYGMKDTAYPGYFVVNRKGVVIERFADPDYDNRRSGNALIGSLFPELLEPRGRPIAAPHLEVSLGASDTALTLGTKFTLLVDVRLPRDMHIYAPEVKGYIPVKVTLDPSQWIKSATAKYPVARMLHLKAIDETVPVYENEARITIDVLIANRTALMRMLNQAPDLTQPVTIDGKLEYQACDSKVCYFPTSVPLSWDVTVRLPDRERVAPENQAKPDGR